MNDREALDILAAFGEGIDPDRPLVGLTPNHRDFHRAAEAVTGIRWGRLDTDIHLAHHIDLADHLDVGHPDTTGPGLAGHAEHSNQLLQALLPLALEAA